MATSSMVRARPIPCDVESDSESSREVPMDVDAESRKFSLQSPPLPKLHSIKPAFSLVLGGILIDPLEPDSKDTIQVDRASS